MAQLKASIGLRSTRATARQRDVSESGPSIVSEPWFLRKTHLTLGPTDKPCMHALACTYIYRRLKILSQARID
jgi:hypothetical protein